MTGDHGGTSVTSVFGSGAVFCLAPPTRSASSRRRRRPAPPPRRGVLPPGRSACRRSSARRPGRCSVPRLRDGRELCDDDARGCVGDPPNGGAEPSSHLRAPLHECDPVEVDFNDKHGARQEHLVSERGENQRWRRLAVRTGGALTESRNFIDKHAHRGRVDPAATRVTVLGAERVKGRYRVSQDTCYRVLHGTDLGHGPDAVP